MESSFRAGDRVRISPSYHWAQGVMGVVQPPPDYVVGLADGWAGLERTVQGRVRPLRFYWVEFDVPQRDADGDGPYFAGEIDAEYLWAL